MLTIITETHNFEIHFRILKIVNIVRSREMDKIEQVEYFFYARQSYRLSHIIENSQ